MRPRARRAWCRLHPAGGPPPRPDRTFVPADNWPVLYTVARDAGPENDPRRGAGTGDRTAAAAAVHRRRRERLAELDGDPAVMRFISTKTRSRAEIETEVLPRFLGYYSAYRDFGHWAADTRDDGELHRLVRPAPGGGRGRRDGGLGRRAGAARPCSPRLPAAAGGLGPGVRDRGVAGPGPPGLRRTWREEIVATTMTINTGSRAVMEKAGLRFARAVHLNWPDPVDGNEHGDVEYRLRREDWLAAAAAEPGRGPAASCPPPGEPAGAVHLGQRGEQGPRGGDRPGLPRRGRRTPPHRRQEDAAGDGDDRARGAGQELAGTGLPLRVPRPRGMPVVQRGWRSRR